MNITIFSIGERALRSSVINWNTNNIKMALVSKEGFSLLNKNINNIKYLKSSFITTKSVIGKTVQITESELIFTCDDVIFKKFDDKQDVYAIVIYCDDFNIPICYWDYSDNVMFNTSNTNKIVISMNGGNIRVTY